jgi:hypothetical protein
MHGRIMAHNGGFGELTRLDEQLGSYASLVLGETDSERDGRGLVSHAREQRLQQK